MFHEALVFFASTFVPKQGHRRTLAATPASDKESKSEPCLTSPWLPDRSTVNVNFRLLRSLDSYSHDAEPDITAILPVIGDSLFDLNSTISSMLSVTPSMLSEIIVACHPKIAAKAEQALKKILVSHPKAISTTILTWSHNDDASLGMLHILPSVFTQHVLLLDVSAFRHVDGPTSMILLNSVPPAVPVGPHGFLVSASNVSCVQCYDGTTPAAYLVPPFLAPTSLLIEAENGVRWDVDTWASLGHRIARTTGAGLGGLVLTSRRPDNWCSQSMSKVDHIFTSTFLQPFYEVLQAGTDSQLPTVTRYNILVPGLNELESLSPTVCEIVRRGHTAQIMLFSGLGVNPSSQFSFTGSCHLHFEVMSHDLDGHSAIMRLKTWILATDFDVFMYSSEELSQTTVIEAAIKSSQSSEGIIVRIPVTDLPFTQWMAMLELSEWKNWHKPKIDLVVITNNRPRSLSRLLHSLLAARYYGDLVHMKINLDQTADANTRRIAARFRWNFGVVHLQHRVKPAGLMSAVVEAWYPHCNNSYGVFLEDDVEVSPMFYAWIKAAILRYRYGLFRDLARPLFGVSLYQPLNLELRPGGRIPFNPRNIFTESHLVDIRTPYLSQVPCSWGAVYFPEHFREFHDYLSVRLSEATHEISKIIIPNIRSNNWTRSWKKYFNELVYLRGYVMLYPNYNFSLSTNHLEPGTHVKNNSRSVSEFLRRQFDVPLMPLPSFSSTTPKQGLLDIPGDTLPAWDELPVLDFWGNITSHQEIVRRGQIRHEMVSGCLSRIDQITFDASELLCARVLPQE